MSNITEQAYLELCDDFKKRIEDKNEIIELQKTRIQNFVDNVESNFEREKCLMMIIQILLSIV
jgi:hypothetical protein